MYLQLHSVKEPSKNRDIWVRVLFGSLRGRVRFCSGSCTFFYFRVLSLFYSWQNLGSGSGRSCWVRVVSRFYFVSSNLFESYNMNREGALTAGVALYGGYSLLVVR